MPECLYSRTARPATQTTTTPATSAASACRQADPDPFSAPASTDSGPPGSIGAIATTLASSAPTEGAHVEPRRLNLEPRRALTRRGTVERAANHKRPTPHRRNRSRSDRRVLRRDRLRPPRRRTFARITMANRRRGRRGLFGLVGAALVQARPKAASLPARVAVDVSDGRARRVHRAGLRGPSPAGRLRRFRPVSTRCRSSSPVPGRRQGAWLREKSLAGDWTCRRSQSYVCPNKAPAARERPGAWHQNGGP